MKSPFQYVLALFRGDEKVADFTVRGADWPALKGTLAITGHGDRFGDLFELMSEAARRRDREEVRRLQDEIIGLDLRMVDETTGDEYTGILIGIDGEETRVRYTDRTSAQ